MKKVDYLADRFASRIADGNIVKTSLLKGGHKPDLTSTEMSLIKRAFYYYEIYCNLTKWSSNAYLLIEKMAPLGVEQLASVYDFLMNIMTPGAFTICSSGSDNNTT